MKRFFNANIARVVKMVSLYFFFLWAFCRFATNVRVIFVKQELDELIKMESQSREWRIDTYVRLSREYRLFFTRYVARNSWRV